VGKSLQHPFSPTDSAEDPCLKQTWLETWGQDPYLLVLMGVTAGATEYCAAQDHQPTRCRDAERDRTITMPSPLPCPARSEPAQRPTLARPSTSRWLVYILRCSDGSLYTGITNDLPNV